MATIYVCSKCKHSKALQNAIVRGTDATVKLVGCQDVCKQPVAGTRIEGRLQWFGGLDQPKRQKAFIEVVNGRGGRLPDVLAKARNAKRAGKSPR